MTSIAQYELLCQRQADIIRNQQEKIEELADELMWRDRLDANPSLSSSEKVIGVAIKREIALHNPADDGMTRIYIPNIVERTGISRFTVGKTLKHLAESGIVTRRVDAHSNGTDVTKDIYIALSPQLLINPDGVAHSEERNHGGKRTRCQSCGSANLVKLTRVTCRDCGEVYSEVTAEVNNPEIEEQEYVHPVLDYPAPARACYVCNDTNWIVAIADGKAFYQCGTCNPPENKEV